MGSQVRGGSSYPLGLFAQQAYNDPQFALGNLLGSYLANVYMQKQEPDNGGSIHTGAGNSPDFQSSLDANVGNKFALDNNGNAVYQSPDLTPGVYVDNTAPINQQLGSFKDYVTDKNGRINNTGLLNFTQLAKQATPAAEQGIQTAENSNIPAIDGTLGAPLVGSMNMQMNGDSPFGNTWQYNGPYSKKDYGDIVNQATISPEDQPNNTAMYSIDNDFPGMIQKRNIDLAHRPVVSMPNGSVATVRSIGVNIDGKEYLIPTVSKDGRLLSNDEAIDEFRKSGEHLGVFNSPESGTKYAQALHNQQDQMYAENNKEPIADDQPIKPIDTAPIKDTGTPIKPNEPPITEDKKEILKGKNLQIMSANDGQMYDFTVSDDGKWIQWGNSKIPAAEKDKLITAMHNPQQAMMDLQDHYTPLHSVIPSMTTEEATIYANATPGQRAQIQGRLNNIDLRDMNDLQGAGVLPGVHIGMQPSAIRNVQTQNTEPHPFNAQQKASEYIRTMMNRGFNMDAINDRMQTYMPEWQKQEDDYNQYQSSAIWPMYYTSIQKGDYNTAAQLAQGMLQYNSELGSQMLAGLPTGLNYYSANEANKRAAIAAQNKQNDMITQHQWKEEDDDKNFNRTQQLKSFDARLKYAYGKMSYADKLAYNRANTEQQMDLLRQYGATNEDIRSALGVKTGKGKTSSSTNDKDFSKAKDIITNYYKWEGNGENPYAGSLAWAKDTIDNQGLVPLTSNNNYNEAMSWITDRLERNSALGNQYSKDQMEQLIDNNLEPTTAKDVKNSINWSDYFGDN